MSRFVNDATGVTFSVDDSKDDRHGLGFTPAADDSTKKAPAKKATSSKSSK